LNLIASSLTYFFTPYRLKIQVRKANLLGFCL
jgi:hypothetical protein